jgi:ABC-type branched-subunit amino acid transport system substrate-binding protein
MQNALKILTFFCLTIFATAQEPHRVIKIAGMFALTGDAQEFGQIEQEGVLLAIEEWNAAHSAEKKLTFELLSEDMESDSRKAVSAFRRLVDIEHAPVIIGPTWADTYQSILALADKSHTLIVTPSAEAAILNASHAGVPYEFVLSTYFRSETEITKLLQGLKERGITRVAAIFEEEPFFLYLRDIFLKQAPLLGITVTNEEHFLTELADHLSVMVRFKKNNPQALFMGAAYQLGIVKMLKAKQQFLPTITLAGVHDFEGHLRTPSIRPLIGKLIYSRYGVSDRTVAERFTKRFKHPPILTALPAYDTANFIMQAIVDGARTAEEIRTYLKSKEFASATFGRTRFQADGGLTEPVVEIVQIE